MRKLCKALRSKTIWFAMVLAVLSVLQEFVVALPYPPQTQAIIGVVIAVAIVILRFMTVSSLDEK